MGHRDNKAQPRPEFPSFTYKKPQDMDISWPASHGPSFGSFGP